MSVRWVLVVLLLLVGCRRVPAADAASSTLEVSNLTVSFPREEQGDLFFEVLLPRQVARITTLRWELFIGPRRFAEGVVMAPDITSDAGGRRHARVEAPLVYRHLGWREGSTWLDVGLKGDVQPFGADEGGRLHFRVRQQVLVTAAPVLDERGE
jgi:hypothetical protein